MAKQSKLKTGENPFATAKEGQLYKPTDEFKKDAYFSSFSQYKNVYDFSISNKIKFWSGEAKELHWFKPWTEVKKGTAFNSKWFAGGKTNITYNCLDRHIIKDKRNKAAVIWESENGETKILTYQLLYTEVCRFANALKKLKVKKGDNIIIYMGTIPEAVIAALACARIGAVHSIVHFGLSANALRERIEKLQCKVIITQDFILRKGERIPVKEKVDDSLLNNLTVTNVIVYKRIEDSDINLTPKRDFLWREVITGISDKCDSAVLDSQHPLFSLFTNGADGELQKILHTTGGYMVQAYLTAKWVFDLKDDDIFWAASDFAWISGHTYSIYGPLLNGATTFIYEGVPVYPEPDRYWQLISNYRINIFYTNPTTLRAFLKLGSKWVLKHDISSLRLLGTKGEPIKPETWLWYYEIVGKKLCPIVNTWLQSETGAIIISSLPGAANMKPGSAGYAFPGVEIDVVNLNGESVNTGEAGYLLIKDSWPSMFKTLKEDKSEIKLYCWQLFKGSYFTGDAAIKEKNGFIRILGRVDDVIKAAGNRVSGAQIEKVLLSHTAVKKAAVVKRPDEIIGNAIVAFVTLKDAEGTPLLKEELRSFVSENIGAIAKPDELIFINEMPTLESGKINRHLLRERVLKSIPVLKGKEADDFNILEKLREDYQTLHFK